MTMQKQLSAQEALDQLRAHIEAGCDIVAECSCGATRTITTLLDLVSWDERHSKCK